MIKRKLEIAQNQDTGKAPVMLPQLSSQKIKKKEKGKPINVISKEGTKENSPSKKNYPVFWCYLKLLGVLALCYQYYFRWTKQAVGGILIMFSL